MPMPNWKLATLETGNISTMAHFRRMNEALHGPAGGLETASPLPGPRWRPAPAGGAPGARALPAGKMASRVKKERDEAYGFDARFVRPRFVKSVCHDDFPEKVARPAQGLGFLSAFFRVRDGECGLDIDLFMVLPSRARQTSWQCGSDS